MGNKKRPQVESCDPFKYKRRNKSNKCKTSVAKMEVGRKGNLTAAAGGWNIGDQPPEPASTRVTYSGRAILTRVSGLL